MNQTQRVMQHLENITPEQIGRCSKLFDGPTGFYAVLSETDNLTEYHVRYDRQRGYSCTCPAGAEGFARVHHKSGVCKHVRWSLAAEMEERAALAALAAKQEREEEARRQAEQPVAAEIRPGWYNAANETSYHDHTRRHLLISGGQEIDDASYARVINAQAKPQADDDQEPPASREFRII